MTYDYILYDNRTLGRSGYDWAVKAATGLLKEDQAATQKFVEYCLHSFDTRRGTLSNFGAALGGIRLNGGEYLLCVTLETQDQHQRSSCAFVGILCQQSTSLKDLLMQGDPILSARQTSEAAGPKLVLEGKALITDVPLPASDRRAGRYPFRSGSTPRNAAEILVRQIQKGAMPPSILGITQWSASRSHLLGGYEFTYVLGLPANAEVRQRPEKIQTQANKSFPKAGAWLLVAALVCVAVVAFVYQLHSSESTSIVPPDPSNSPTPLPESSPTIQPQPSGGAQGGSPEAFLQRFKTLLDHIESTSTQNLPATREGKTLNDVQLLPEFKRDREKMIELLSADLPHFKEAVKNENFDHFFQAEMKTLSSAERAKIIREKAGKILPPTEGCSLIRSSFALWTENSETGTWCTLVEDFTKEIRQSNSSL
jgi:hypothetical protein